MKNKPWPKDPTKCVNVETLLDPVKDVFEQICNWSKFADSGVYRGYQAPPSMLHMIQDISFDEETIKYHEDQGRDVLTMVLTAAFQLGYEQGSRSKLRSLKITHDSIKLLARQLHEWTEDL